VRAQCVGGGRGVCDGKKTLKSNARTFCFSNVFICLLLFDLCCCVIRARCLSFCFETQSAAVAHTPLRVRGALSQGGDTTASCACGLLVVVQHIKKRGVVAAVRRCVPQRNASAKRKRADESQKNDVVKAHAQRARPRGLCLSPRPQPAMQKKARGATAGTARRRARAPMPRHDRRTRSFGLCPL
jgi:hypothetical protein